MFVRVHVGYQTCINFFARFRADLKSPHSDRLAYAAIRALDPKAQSSEGDTIYYKGGTYYKRALDPKAKTSEGDHVYYKGDLYYK